MTVSPTAPPGSALLPPAGLGTAVRLVVLTNGNTHARAVLSIRRRSDLLACAPSDEVEGGGGYVIHVAKDGLSWWQESAPHLQE